MKNNLEKLKLLPKIEVSFQDDFSGSKREFTLTPHYILRNLKNIHFDDEVLFWEKDQYNNKEDYICVIGKIVPIEDEFIKNDPDISFEELALIDDKPFKADIKEEDFFRLPLDSLVFA